MHLSVLLASDPSLLSLAQSVVTLTVRLARDPSVDLLGSVVLAAGYFHDGGRDLKTKAYGAA